MSSINNPIVRYYRRRNILYFEKRHYKISKIINIQLKTGLLSLLKYSIKISFSKPIKNDIYYINLANIHALFNIKGKLKTKYN